MTLPFDRAQHNPAFLSLYTVYARSYSYSSLSLCASGFSTTEAIASPMTPLE